MAELMIYGCTGYTGRLTAAYAKSLQLKFVIAGRSKAKVQALGAELNVPSRVFDISDASAIDTGLDGVKVLLNCAGPFKYTAKPLMEACIRNGMHYLDVAAELDSYHVAGELDQAARNADVMLMPGCGGSVAMLGCLTGFALQDAQSPAVSVDVALHVAGSMSRGSAISASEGLTTACLKRVKGTLVEQQSSATTSFDFGDGQGSVNCFPVTLPDLITIWKSTGVNNIQTFVHISGDALPSGDLASMANGPTEEEREANPYHASAVVVGEDGSMTRAVLHAVNGYTFTARASVEAAQRVLQGGARGGFQTPAVVFGTHFVESIAGSKMHFVK